MSNQSYKWLLWVALIVYGFVIGYIISDLEVYLQVAFIGLGVILGVLGIMYIIEDTH